MTLSPADIPEDVRRRDDEFWGRHERTRLERSSQPCCTLSGMLALLSAMPGRLCVVVHGERDCLNSFRAFQGACSSSLFCTRVTEKDCIAGKTSARLRLCVESVVRDRQPELVVVLSSCLIEMIGEDLAASVAGLSRRLDTPIRFLKTSGLKCSPEQAMLDMLWRELADWVLQREERAGRRRVAADGEVFVFGLPASLGPPGELQAVLERCGLTLNAAFPASASLEDWKRLARAPAVFVVDRSAYPLVTSRLEAGGIDVIEVPLPIGLGPSRTFFDRIAGRFGKQAEARKALAGAVAAVRREVAAFRRKYGPRRLAYAVRMGSYYEADRLAYGGLGDLAFFLELGFRPTLLVQGAQDAGSRAFHADQLRRLGQRGPFLMFPDPFILLQLLRKKRFDLAYFSRNAFRDDERIDVRFIETRSLKPFLQGARSNIARVRQVLDGKG
jgi:nitrogenase molybdenum-iron protein alpha/beta subunit